MVLSVAVQTILEEIHMKVIVKKPGKLVAGILRLLFGVSKDSPN